MIEFREAAADDRDAILALRGRCFGDEDPEKRDPRFWEWEFREARVFVARAGARVVSHIAFVPQSYVVHHGMRRGVLAVDAMTDPEFRGQRLLSQVAAFAAECLASSAAFSLAWQIRKPVLGGILAAGWLKEGGANVLVRPLLAPAFGSVVTQSPDADTMAAIAQEMFERCEGYLARTPAYLRWRYFENPLWRYDVSMTSHAWIATRRTTLKGIATMAIADVAWRRGWERDARGLLALAMREARSKKARLAATLVTMAHPAFPWFLRRGFIPGPHRFRLLLNNFSLGRPPAWALSWGDTDHL